MKKFYLLTKTLLVAALLCLSMNVGAVTNLATWTGVVGTTDNTSGFDVLGSKSMSLAAGDEYVITFVNYNKGASGTDYWENWAFISNVFACRADHGASNPYWGTATNVNYTGNSWSDIYSSNTQWLQAYNGVTVTVTVSRNDAGDGITISHTATTNKVDEIASQTYAGTFTATVGASAEINFYLTVEDAHLEIKKVLYSNDEGGTLHTMPQMTYVNYDAGDTSYGEIAYGETAESGYNSVGSSVGFANTGWGVNYITYINTDASDIPDGTTITSATLTFEGSGSAAAGKSRASIFGAGYNNSSWSSSLTCNTADKNITTVGTEYTTTSKLFTNFETVTLNITDAIKNDADKIVNTIVYDKSADHSYIRKPEITVVYSAATLYEATFSETNSLNPTVTVYSDAGRSVEIAKNELEANTTYYYTAVLEGYNNYEGSFDVGTSDPSVNFTMTLKTRYTFKVNAVNSVGGAVLKTIYEDADSYEGKVHGNIVYPKYLTGANNIVTYSKDNDTYGERKTAQAQDETYTVSYTAYDGVAYFVEVEDVVSATAYGSWNCSNGGAVRGFSTAKSIFTVPATGKYDVTYAICNNNVNNALSCTLSKNDTPISTEEGLQYVSINYIKTTGIITNSDISLAKDDVLKLTPSTSNGIVDYMLVELKSVSATIGDNKFTTFASPYPLDLTSDTQEANGFTAYRAASIDESTVTFKDDVDQNVVANTGILLKGTANATVSIPVVASGTALAGNSFHVNSSDDTFDAEDGYTYYGMNKDSNPLTFGTFNPESVAIPANKAYLKVNSSGELAARQIEAIFGDELTGISEAKSEVEFAKEGKFFVDGKLVIFKKGMKFNANGQVIK